MKYSKPQYIPVNAGDLATIRLLPHDCRGEQITATVVRVSRRYGRCNHGTTESAPLVTYRAQCSSKLEYCDASRVVAVLRLKRPIQTPMNVYREREYPNPDIVVAKKGIWLAPLYILAANALSLMPYPIERPIHGARLLELYNQAGRPGQIGKVGSLGLISGLFFRVRAAKFKRWVSQNWSRIILTVEEAHQLENEAIERRERDYWDNVQADYDFMEQQLDSIGL